MRGGVEGEAVTQAASSPVRHGALSSVQRGSRARSRPGMAPEHLKQPVSLEENAASRGADCSSLDGLIGRRGTNKRSTRQPSKRWSAPYSAVEARTDPVASLPAAIDYSADDIVAANALCCLSQQPDGNSAAPKCARPGKQPQQVHLVQGQGGQESGQDATSPGSALQDVAPANAHTLPAASAPLRAEVCSRAPGRSRRQQAKNGPSLQPRRLGHAAATTPLPSQGSQCDNVEGSSPTKLLSRSLSRSTQLPSQPLTAPEQVAGRQQQAQEQQQQSASRQQQHQQQHQQRWRQMGSVAQQPADALQVRQFLAFQQQQQQYQQTLVARALQAQTWSQQQQAMLHRSGSASGFPSASGRNGRSTAATHASQSRPELRPEQEQEQSGGLRNTGSSPAHGSDAKASNTPAAPEHEARHRRDGAAGAGTTARAAAAAPASASAQRQPVATATAGACASSTGHVSPLSAANTPSVRSNGAATTGGGRDTSWHSTRTPGVCTGGTYGSTDSLLSVSNPSARHVYISHMIATRMSSNSRVGLSSSGSDECQREGGLRDEEMDVVADSEQETAVAAAAAQAKRASQSGDATTATTGPRPAAAGGVAGLAEAAAAARKARGNGAVPGHMLNQQAFMLQAGQMQGWGGGVPPVTWGSLLQAVGPQGVGGRLPGGVDASLLNQTNGLTIMPLMQQDGASSSGVGFQQQVQMVQNRTRMRSQGQVPAGSAAVPGSAGTNGSAAGSLPQAYTQQVADNVGRYSSGLLSPFLGSSQPTGGQCQPAAATAGGGVAGGALPVSTGGADGGNRSGMMLGGQRLVLLPSGPQMQNGGGPVLANSVGTQGAVWGVMPQMVQAGGGGAILLPQQQRNALMVGGGCNGGGYMLSPYLWNGGGGRVITQAGVSELAAAAGGRVLGGMEGGVQPVFMLGGGGAAGGGLGQPQVLNRLLP